MRARTFPGLVLRPAQLRYLSVQNRQPEEVSGLRATHVSPPELLTTSDSLAVPLFFMKSPFAAPCLWNSTSATSAWQCLAGAHRPDGCTPVTTQRHTRAVVAANEKSCGAAVPFAPSASAICLPQVDEPGAGPVWR